VVAGTALVINPPLGQPASYTETSNFQCSTCTLPNGSASPFSSQQPFNAPCAPGACSYADFSSPPLTRDIISVGVPTAHLHISGTGVQQVVFYGKVYDVAPDGSQELIKRLISPVRVFDSTRPVDFQLAGFAHRFAAGHRVLLEIAATDLTSGSNRIADVVTLTQPAGADPSTFSLPVDSVAAAATAFPPPNPSGLPTTGTSPWPRGLLPLLALLLAATGGLGARLHRRRR
jgi:ABC-2 type transport system ATP-binding protein